MFGKFDAVQQNDIDLLREQRKEPGAHISTDKVSFRHSRYPRNHRDNTSEAAGEKDHPDGAVAAATDAGLGRAARGGRSGASAAISAEQESPIID